MTRQDNDVRRDAAVNSLPEPAVNAVTNARQADPQMNGVLFIQLKLNATLFGFGSRRQLLADGAET
jgi:hypothetical protein